MAVMMLRRPSPPDAGGLSTYELFATLPAQIAVRIGGGIVEGDFKPGEKLREADLAKAFGVSRASVREALRLVESEGLVTILPQRGAQVTALTAEEVRDVFEIRANLMGLACQRLAAGITPEVARKLEELLKALRSSRDDGEAYARSSLSISEYCVRNAGSKRLADLILSFGRQTARYTRLSLSTGERRRLSLAHWRELVDAVTGGKQAAVERLARQLVLDTRDAALKMLAEKEVSQTLSKSNREPTGTPLPGRREAR
jgi:DNA-binding GntR family transcriptional regulator